LFWQQEVSEALASQTHKTIDVACGDITFSFFVAPIVEADYVNLYGRDITERKEAEQTMKDQLDELLRWQEALLGRDDRNQELKREVNELLRQLGKPIRYSSQVDAVNEPPAGGNRGEEL
jgi:hypothetical protein